ncbi:hypothetical protein FRB91_005496 [Serendipita sp. 411]|nr:hypothetical protein FRB91_005496 [Serendipita sp. 411]
MIVSANLENIPFESLLIGHNCWEGILLNFTLHYDFAEEANYWVRRQLTGTLINTWKNRFPVVFQDIESGEIINYLSMARNSSNFYDNRAIAGLSNCAYSIYEELIFCMSGGNWGDQVGCLNRGESWFQNTEFLCELSAISGNPDIGGVGLFSAHVIMLTIFTLLTIGHAFFLLGSCFHFGRRLHSSRWEPILNAISISFLDSMAFLSISVLIAGISYTKKAASTYEVTFAMAASGVTLAPLITMTAVMYSSLRRKKLRRRIVNVASMLFWVHFFFHISRSGGNNEVAICIVNDAGTSSMIGQFIILGTSGLYLLPRGVYWLSRTPKYLWGMFRTGWNSVILRRGNLGGTGGGSPASIRPRSQYLLSLFFIVWGHTVTWMNFYSIIQLRQGSATHRSDDNAENHMGYGQIVSLFIWLPIFADAIHAIIYGPKRALEGKIPLPFSVQEECQQETWPHG